MIDAWYRRCDLQILCVIPAPPVVRWVFAGLAFLLSGWFLGSNVYPILATVRSRACYILMAKWYGTGLTCFTGGRKARAAHHHPPCRSARSCCAVLQDPFLQLLRRGPSWPEGPHPTCGRNTEVLVSDRVGYE